MSAEYLADAVLLGLKDPAATVRILTEHYVAILDELEAGLARGSALGPKIDQARTLAAGSDTFDTNAAILGGLAAQVLQDRLLRAAGAPWL